MHRPRTSLLAALASTLLVATAAHSERPRPASPNARPRTVELLRQEIAQRHDASDRGGRAWIEADDGSRDAAAVAATPGRWALVYEAGPLGIREGGSLLVQVPPFLGWSPPQLNDPLAPGYVIVSSDAPGVKLRPRVVRQMMVLVRIRGRALATGERIRVVYGAGPAGALADVSAERDSRFWIHVDGDADGTWLPLPDSPSLDVAPGAPSRLHLVWPSVARPGETVRLHVSVLDAHDNAGIAFAGRVRLHGIAGPALDGPRIVEFAASEGGVKEVALTVHREGIFQIAATAPAALVGHSNPLVVSSSRSRVRWADLHGHSNLSDGTGLPTDFLDYARDVAGLDVAALTDHDHWGVPRYVDSEADVWETIRRATRGHHAPGRFVALLGYEWTSWVHGHRHVLYFGDEGSVLSSIDPRYESPSQLWDGLRGQRVVTIAHHPAGEPIATNWSIPPDPALEPVTEIVSMAGSSEAQETPFPVRGGLAGSFVRDALARGYRLGFVGSSDSHDGHPGCPAGPPALSCGLAALVTEELTRDAVLATLRARRVYATNGPRILLDVALDDRPMGATVPAGRAATLRIEAVGTSGLVSLELVRSGAPAERIACEGRAVCSVERRLQPLQAGEILYVRAIQDDHGAAWSSPFFFE